MRYFFIAALFLLTMRECHAAGGPSPTPPVVPPAIAREFRGVWIATVANIDWPSKPGLTVAQQKIELISLLSRAQQLKLNAVIFQVRPACDAMYDSKIEPWSEYLTGTMGKAPEPFYDPLAFAIEEAHKRGMELHAWFNPYRALHKSHSGNISSGHISRTHPELVRSYGEYLWLDPGERVVQEYSLRVVMDVVKRYDIDGVQFDDYFYPDPTGMNREFPDEASWRKYGVSGKLSRADWRRENVNVMISRVYTSIKAAKPWVKFGVAPFGIWQPGNPPQITGFDPYAKLFADSRKWLMNGWADYFSPQLYWPIEQKEQSFPVLLNWWTQQNVKHRHLWPGMAATSATTRPDWKPTEIADQVRLVQKEPGDDGFILYNASSLLSESARAQELRRTLLAGFNNQLALIPASPWLGGPAPAKPNLLINDSPSGVRLNWGAGSTNSVNWWVVQTKLFGDWKTEILPKQTFTESLPARPEAVAVSAIDRVGNASPPQVIELKKNPGPPRILLK